MSEKEVRGRLSTAALHIAQARMNLSVQRRLDAIFYGWKPEPLTRRQKTAAWFAERADRVVLAWRVLRGDDIHEGCE